MLINQRANFSESQWYKLIKGLYHLMVLNILFILTAWPIVTIGAASTALYRVFYLDATEGREFDYKLYLQAFSQYFRRVTPVWSLGCASFVGLWWLLQMLVVRLPIATLLILPLMVQLLMVATVVFALFARFELGIRASVRQAWFFANRHLWWTLMTMVVVGLLTTLSFVVPALQLFLVFSLCHMLIHKIVGYLLKESKVIE
jgi:uncharacterized membrane protein YesL